MTSSEYWAERFRQLTETQSLSDDELIKEIEKLYKQAQTEIESKIARWYMKFAENNEISMSEAKKLLKADELEEFRWTVEEYIKHGETNIDDVFAKQLVNASSKVHISRYEALLTELRQTAEKIMGTQASKLTEHLKTAYSENYLHTAFEIQKGTGVGTYLGGIDERSLEQVVRKPWAVDGSNFSERIWKDRNSLVSEIDTQLKRNIALGKGPDEAATAIAKRFETSKSNAYRLVMTESAAISAKATKKCYDELDVEEFEVLETLDAHTCEICGAMDGKHFPKSQYEIGVTVPPFHPRCRGTTVPYFDDMEGYGERAARDLDGSTFYVSSDTTYEQWKNSQKAFTNGKKGDIIKSKKERGIETDMSALAEKHTAAGNRRSPFYKLTETDIEFVKNEISVIDGNVNEFVFNSDVTRGTCFLASDGKVHIRGNIFPDEYSTHPRDKMSVRAVLAHEYYGHRPYRLQYIKEDNDSSPDALEKIMSRAWADEFRASYMAAKNAPNLSPEDRLLLIQDALSRAEDAGVSIKYNDFIRRVLYE